MRKALLVVLALLVCGVGAVAQQVNLQQLDPAEVDMSRADLSDVRLYFQGPMELYVSGVEYGDRSYAAILNYDGGSTFDIELPDTVSRAGKPVSLDLSGVEASLTQNGVRISNVVANGYRYSGVAQFQPQQRNFVVTSISSGGTAVSDTAETLRQRLSALQQERDDLQDRVATLEDQIEQRDARIERLSQEGGAEDEIQQLQQENDELQAQVTELRRQLESARAGEEPARVTARDRLSRTLVSGVSRGSAQSGSWSRSGSRVSQTDGSRLYAKYAISQSQNSSELLYRFTGRATGSGWRGYGLHFLASGSRAADSYGYGSSYLVWVTRDPGHLQTDQTFVQLYRSYDDVRMVQLASKAVDGSITSSNDIEVYVNRNDRRISVSVDGELVFTFTDSDMIRRGSGLALRALGTASFSNLRVQSR